MFFLFLWLKEKRKIKIRRLFSRYGWFKNSQRL